MNKCITTILFALLALVLNAQSDSKYLRGAVPEIDGKIIFSRTINVETKTTADQLFTLITKWADTNYQKEDGSLNRILLSDTQKRDIACFGEQNLIFKKSALVLDQATMSYQLVLHVEANQCLATIRNIKYKYASESTKGLVAAEDLVSDKVALNGDKMNRYHEKFRVSTVDSINNVFNSLDLYLNGMKVAGATQAQTQVTTPVALQQEDMATVVAAIPTSENSVSNAMNGYKSISADKIPGNIIKLLNDWTLITSGSGEKVNTMTASWGGLGVLWQKPISICFLNPTRHSVTTMDDGETYTISFYTEAHKDALLYCGSTSGRAEDKIKGSGLTPIQTPSGATAFSEAWMVLECKKILAQPISKDAVKEENLSDDWTKDGYHKIYIGEILNVWVK